MKLLSIDTSSDRCSVCLLEDTTVLKELNIEDKKTHSEKLMPLIEQVLQETNSTLDQIGLLACSKGPGSFTGIRIGIATVKAFCDAKQIPAIGISSLEGLAYHVSSYGKIIAIIDARNDTVYAGIFTHSKQGYQQEGPLTAISVTELLNKLQKEQEHFFLVGDGSILYHDLIVSMLREKAIFIAPDQNKCSSATIGKAAFAKLQKGITSEDVSLSPLYLRPSQAERTLQEKEKMGEKDGN